MLSRRITLRTCDVCPIFHLIRAIQTLDNGRGSFGMNQGIYIVVVVAIKRGCGLLVTCPYQKLYLVLGIESNATMYHVTDIYFAIYI